MTEVEFSEESEEETEEKPEAAPEVKISKNLTQEEIDEFDNRLLVSMYFNYKLKRDDSVRKTVVLLWGEMCKRLGTNPIATFCNDCMGTGAIKSERCKTCNGMGKYFKMIKPVSTDPKTKKMKVTPLPGIPISKKEAYKRTMETFEKQKKQEAEHLAEKGRQMMEEVEEELAEEAEKAASAQVTEEPVVFLPIVEDGGEVHLGETKFVDEKTQEVVTLHLEQKKLPKTKDIDSDLGDT
jgi:hypothetical protein